MWSADVLEHSVSQKGDHALLKICLTLHGLLCLIEIRVKAGKDKPETVLRCQPTSDIFGHENGKHSR